MKRFLLLWMSFIVVLTAPLLHAAEAAKPSGQITILQEILILNSYHPGYAWSDDEQAGIIDVFRGKDKNWLPVIEYLDLKRLPAGRHLAELKQLFRRKYQNKKFSVVIAMDDPALEFAIDNQEKLFRNAPIVFCGINNYTSSLLKGHTDVTGIMESIDIAGTIEVMLRLHPVAREIFVPHDYTVSNLAVRREIEALVPRFSAKVRFRFSDPLTMDELLKELERLPKDSLVLEIGFITDKSGRTFGMTEAVMLFFEHSPVPVYSTYEQRLGFGIVGGKLLSARIHGTNAARIALRVLAGEKASAIPVVLESDSQFMFDYKVMSRFGIPLSALPEGSTVINKPVSFYATHRVVIQTALGIIVFLAVVISLLMINIIQRRRSAIALRASEAKYYDLYENAPDMYLSVDAKTATIIECNNTLVETLGYAKEDIVGRSIYEIYHPDCKEDVKRLFQQFTATGEVRDAELKIMCKDGGIIDVDLNTSAVRDKDGKIIRSRSIWRDITERKHVEEALRESEERLRFHTDNSPMAVVEWNTDFIVTRWTGAAEKMFGWSAEETIGKPIMELRMIYEEDIPIVQSVMQRLTDGVSKYVVSSNRNYTKKGEVIHCEWYNSVLHDSVGKMVSVMSQVLDVTDRKQAEEKIQASLREKETMLKEIHHRVKNNLQVVSSLLGLQSSYVQDELSRKIFQESQDRVRIMANIHTMLYQSEDLTRVDFGVFIRDLIGRLQQSYGIAGSPIEVHVDVGDVFPTIETSIPCGLILNELVSNALKHAFPGGRGGEVNISMKTAGDQFVLKVQDNGIGFPVAVDFLNPRSLGLELVKLLVEQINGIINFQVEGGTTFTIKFPAVSK